MKKNILDLFYIIAAFFLMIACNEMKVDNLGPTILIESPAKDAMFCGGKDTVDIIATIQDNDELHNVSWQITNKETVLAIGSAHSHDSPFLLKTKWFADVQAHLDLILTITASDHNDNQNEANVHFHVHMPGDCHKE